MLLLARLEAALERLLCFLIGGIMMAAVTVNFANVLARYIFFRPFIWAEEVMQFLDVWAVMLGAAVIARQRAHLKMDLLYQFGPRWLERALEVFNTILALAIAGYVLLQSTTMVRMLAATGQRSVIAGVPMSWMYTSLLIGFGCGVVFLLLWCFRLARPGPVEQSGLAARRELA